ncbi:MAG: hypothetical protein MJ072_03415, partial [Clostridia bacterium]|nr:hypothetical protein [Clostridia bacterium]
NVAIDDVSMKVSNGFAFKGGKSVATNFDGQPSEEDWYIGSQGMPAYEGSGVSIKDNTLVFMNAQDGSMLATAQAYQNFVFSFDLSYIEIEGQEDEEGNITRTPSTWFGIVYGAPEANSMFGTQKMLYFQRSTLDLNNIKFADGTTRKWLGTSEDIYTNADGVITFVVTAIDGTVTIAWYKGEEKMGDATLYNQDTFGHISIQCTQNGNFEIQNAMVINLDEVATYELAEKTVDKVEFSVEEGATYEGAIDLGDMADKTAEFALNGEVEGFTMNEDGTFTFVAPETAPETPIVVNYTVEIDDWNLLGFAPAGDASKYTISGTVEITVTEKAVEPTSEDEPTSEEESHKKAKSGCNSMMMGSSLLVAVMGMAVVLTRKKED